MFICIKMDLALNNLQRLIGHKTQPNKQPDRLCASRKEGRRGIKNIRNCVDIAIQGLEEEYIKKNKERIIIAVNKRIGII